VGWPSAVCVLVGGVVAVLWGPLGVGCVGGCGGCVGVGVVCGCWVWVWLRGVAVRGWFVVDVLVCLGILRSIQVSFLHLLPPINAAIHASLA